MRSDLFQRSKTSPRPYVWLRRLSMLAVLSASEGVGVAFFSSLMFLRSDNRLARAPRAVHNVALPVALVRPMAEASRSNPLR
jgi:hypothetical protein